MSIIRRCEPCGCNDWKAKIKELWEKYQGCVRGVKAGSITAYPDGDGIADIDGAITDAVVQQIPTLLDGYVTDDELAETLENYPTDGDLALTLEDYATTNQLNAKQDKLITGINLRTVNGQNLLGAGDILIRDVLPDTEDANEGDALVLNEDKEPVWGTVDPLPDVTDASAGDALILDADKIPTWGNVDPLPATTSNDHFRPLLTNQNGDGWIVGPSSSVITNWRLRTGASQTIAPGEIVTFGVTGRKGQSNIIIPKFDNNSTQNLEVLGNTQSDSGSSAPSISVKVRNNGNSTIPANTDLNVVVTSLAISVPITSNGTYFTSIVIPASSPVKELPDYTSTDAGKVLSVDANGNLAWITP